MDGLGLRRDQTIAFNIYGLLNPLSLPRQLRNKTAFTAKMVRIVYSTSLMTAPMPEEPNPTQYKWQDMDFTQIVEADFGLQVQWKPHQGGSWFENFLKNVGTMALGFVPVVGPILSVSFALGWTALTDPESFIKELRNQIPTVDLAMQIEKAARLDMPDIMQHLPAGWVGPGGVVVGMSIQSPSQEVARFSAVNVQPLSPDEVGTSSVFLMAREILAMTARPSTSAKTEEVQEDGPGKISEITSPTEAKDTPSEEPLV